MKKEFIIFIILIMGLFLFGCIDDSSGAQQIRNEINSLKSSKNIDSQLTSYSNCLGEFDSLEESEKGIIELKAKYTECENLAEKLIEDIKEISEIISSKKGVLGDAFDMELEVYQEEVGGLLINISFLKANRKMIITDLESKDKIAVCGDLELYKSCDACCVESFPDIGIASYLYQCREVCYDKPSVNITISDYCKNEPSPASCETWPEETCFVEDAYLEKAKLENNLDYCCAISDPEKYVNCYVQTLIDKRRDYLECENIRDATFDGTSQGYVQNLTTKDYCYFVYASLELGLEESIATTKDICSNIENEEMKYMTSCYIPEGMR